MGWIHPKPLDLGWTVEVAAARWVDAGALAGDAGGLAVLWSGDAAGAAQGPLVVPDPACAMVSWTLEDPRIAPARMVLTDRVGRWVTEQVGRYGRR